ncbi:hypothetical protein N7509_000749 [Penicillium cosmopolitanum]|uniref:Uncharacterized protein n=1 Tax=Penicillium cosmopolitanum TaxID=1131564 RepID=A0A9X0BED5_9EURO|nr:uncharacterized protein N7509_000749 [Penicillium cosmopolitanum]KAJ5414122.1 hypothetical protein N7509_000749 [Penicillium cosmopolitanum]
MELARRVYDENRISRTNTPRGSIIIHRDDEDPNPGNCVTFIHPAYGSEIEYRGEKDADYHASISLSKLHSGIKSCGFCAVLYEGVQSKRYMWILSWARFQWLNSHSSDGITYKKEGNLWMHEY